MRNIFLALITFSFSSFSQKTKVDLLVFNAKIYTVNQSFDIAEALAINNGNFVEIGKSADLLKKFLPEKKYDAKGKAIFPGFYDPHSHFINLSEMLSQAILVSTKSFDEVVNQLKKFEKENPKNEWIIGYGWDQNDWATKEFPNKKMLDKAFPNKPVAISRIDGHALLANSKALELANIKEAKAIDGGLIEVVDKEITGILIDNAQNLIESAYPIANEVIKTKRILNAEKLCFSLGLTTVSDAGIGINDIELIDKLQQSNTLKIRDYAMVSGNKTNIDYYLKKGVYKTPKLNVCSFKIYGDGALGSRGACLLAPYADKNTSGFLLTTEKDLDFAYQKIANSAFQVNTHCIGDSANRLVLDLYGKYLKGKNDRRWRIEHAQIVAKSDVEKFCKFSIIPSIQATHATSDMYWAEKRLGPNRVKNAYAFKDLMDQNGYIANGSDFPVEAVNPIYGFHAAVARQDDNNFPANGFQMENAISREQALRAMTIWAAKANFEENERGSIEPGKMADFVILDNDLMTAPKEKLRKIKVLSTFIDGVQVF